MPPILQTLPLYVFPSTMAYRKEANRDSVLGKVLVCRCMCIGFVLPLSCRLCDLLCSQTQFLTFCAPCCSASRRKLAISSHWRRRVAVENLFLSFCASFRTGVVMLAYLCLILVCSNHSTALNKARLEKLRAQQKEVQNVFAAARARLPTVSAGPGYSELLGKLILQGMVALDETDMVVRVRQDDIALAQKIIPSVIAEFKEKYHQDKSRPVNVTVDTQHTVKCSGGAVLSALEGRIICNNTLDMRLVYAYEVSLPRLRHTLFGTTSI